MLVCVYAALLLLLVFCFFSMLLAANLLAFTLLVAYQPIRRSRCRACRMQNMNHMLESMQQKCTLVMHSKDHRKLTSSQARKWWRQNGKTAVICSISKLNGPKPVGTYYIKMQTSPWKLVNSISKTCCNMDATQDFLKHTARNLHSAVTAHIVHLAAYVVATSEIIKILLQLAGDVELNPGPTMLPTNTRCSCTDTPSGGNLYCLATSLVVTMILLSGDIETNPGPTYTAMQTPPANSQPYIEKQYM